MADTSPKWKKPSDVMKMIRKKKKVVVRPRTSQNTESELPSKKSQAKDCSRKRKNPFSCSPRKRAKQQQPELYKDIVQSNSIQETTDLFSILDENEETSPKLQNAPLLAVPISTYNEPDTLDSRCAPEDSQNEMDDKEVKGSPTYPFDWALRTKMRVISKKTFNWCAPLKSKEETGGLVRFIQGTNKSADIDLAAKSEEFQRHCVVWQHPNLPWLKLFPRMVGDSKIGNATSILSEDIQQSLQNDWSESFTSIYQMLRNGHCPYFYLCSHQQTVLYRHGYFHGTEGIQAIVTPTSRGFRESLKSEDIEYTMPLNPRSSNNQQDVENLDAKEEMEALCKVEHDPSAENKEAGDPLHNEGEDEDIEGTNEGASSWLEGLGLDKKKFRSLNPNQVKLQRDSFKLIDNRPESVVVVEGFHTHTLYNLLLNYRGFVANTGVQTGVPPTILAPTAFKGATLKPLKVKQGALRHQQADGNINKGYSVEITGPILPYCYQNLISLLTTTQGDLSATFSVQDPSIPFNGVPPEVGGEKWTENNTHPESLVKEAIRELVFQDDQFSWTAY